MINGTHSMPQLLLPKLDEVKRSAAPTHSPVPPPSKDAENEAGEQKKAEVETKEEAVDKPVKMEAAEGDKKEVSIFEQSLPL